MPRTHLGALCLFLAVPAFSADSLREAFRDPPREYSLEPLWSWNSTLKRDKLIWQIDQLMDKGVYGAYMHARDGLDQGRTPYFSEGFWQAVRDTVEHAEKVGFRAWIYDEDKWPSGAAGGRTIAANPARFRAMGLERTTQEAKGPGPVRVHFPNAMFVVAARKIGGGRIDPKSLTDLTDVNRASGGVWDAPAGEWQISVFRATHGRHELPNYLNPDTVKEFLSNTYEQYAARFSRHFGKTIPGVFFDEIFNLVLAWDPILEERFRTRKGYELRRSLPLLYEDGGPETIRVRCDYFEVYTGLYEDSWFRQLSSWCGRHNLKLTGHTNEPLSAIRDQGDYFRTWRHPQIPGTDNEDFRYTFPRVIGSWKPKQLSSVSHVYDRPRAMVEALGGAGWPITLHHTRYGVNLLAAYGLNYFVFHLFHYAMDTVASMDDWPNTWFHENPYWKYFKKLADYVRRLSFLGSQGEHVAEVAVLYPVEEIWSKGMTPLPPGQPPAVELVDRLMREQIDCDLVDTDSLLSAEPAPGGRARIGKESYRVLVLPSVETVSLAAYRRAASLAAGGLRVVALGNKPRHSAENGGDDPGVLQISERLRSYDAESLIAFLRRELPPDLEVVSGPRAALRYLHRRAGQQDFYLLANTEPRAQSWQLRFHTKGAPEKWNLETGLAEPLSLEEDGALNLRLEGWEAFYVAFNPSAEPRPAPPPPAVLTILTVPGPWTIQLAPTELDYAWRSDPGETRVALPVMDVRFEREQGEGAWRRVKLTDSLNPQRGAVRYLSRWDAPWITRYVHERHPGELGGDNLLFRREIEVPFSPASAWLEVAADSGFECRLNGAPAELDRPRFRQGRNSLECTVKTGGYLLAQGEVLGAGGERLPIRTSGQWSVTAPGKDPLPAFEFAWPPMGRWGEVPLKGERQRLPATVWYRAAIPPGARALDPPQVRGEHQLFVGDRPMPAPLTPGASIQLKARLTQPGDGLQEPLVFRCTRAKTTLGDWRDLGLDWYSGRALYRTVVLMPRAHAAKRLTLDLGELCYTGEVWINGRLVDSLVWPPYRLDVTGRWKPGANELVVVVANLLANQMRWNIFDSAVSSPVSRWWHDGSILREAGMLRSGLMGPVRLEAVDR